MRKYIIFILTVLSSQCILAQSETRFVNTSIKKFEKAQETPRRDYFEDIPQRLTYVVLNDDNSMTDLFFKSAVEDGWNLTAFEFCNKAKFQEIKTDTNFYFLLRVNKMPKKGNGPSTEFMTFLKGDLHARELLEEMPELVSIPLFTEDDRSGRIYSYLPAYINIMQNAIQRIIDGKAFYFRNYLPTLPLSDITDKDILFSEEDIIYPISEEEINQKFRGRIKVVSQSEIDAALEEGRPNTVVSLVIGPQTPVKGSYCYKMLVDTENKQLFLYRKHKITAKKGTGFIKNDFRLIAIQFKVRK